MLLGGLAHKFMQFGVCGSNKWALPVLPWLHTFPWSIWLLCRVSVILGVGGDPWMSCGHLRPSRRAPPNHTFYCNNWGWQGSYALPFKEKCTIPTPCIPLANSNDAVDCCIFFVIVVQYLPPPPSQFCNSRLMQYGACGSNKPSLPITPQRHTLPWPIWLLYKWFVLLVGALGWAIAI